MIGLSELFYKEEHSWEGSTNSAGSVFGQNIIVGEKVYEIQISCTATIHRTQ